MGDSAQEHSIDAHREQSEVLIELQDAVQSPEDQAVIAEWRDEHLSHAEQQIAQLMDRNKERINLLEPAIEARRKFGSDHH